MAPTANELHSAAIAAALIADAERLGRLSGSAGSGAGGSRGSAGAKAGNGDPASISPVSGWAQLARLESLRDR
jgi:hypothetical protein